MNLLKRLNNLHLTGWGTIAGIVASVATVVGLILSLGGDDPVPPSPQSGEKIDVADSPSLALTLGNIVPFSGALRDWGQPAEKAANLAVDRIREAISDLAVDHTIEVLHVDEQTDPDAAEKAAQSAVDDGATCLTGPWATFDTRPVAEKVAIPHGILLISPAATVDDLADLDDDGLVNRTVSPDSFQGPTIANAITHDLGTASNRTANVAALDDPYATGIADAFVSSWEGRGGRIGEQFTYDRDSLLPREWAERVTADSPDVTVIIDFPEVFTELAPGLSSAPGYDPNTTWSADGLVYGPMSDRIGAPLVEGLRATAPGTPNRDPEARAFDRLYKRFPPTEVGRITHDVQNFDAVVLCYLAAVAAGSTDGRSMADQVREISAPPGRRYSWRQLPDAIAALIRGEDIDYQGGSGPIDMNEVGDATAGVYDIYEYIDGEPRLRGEEVIPPS